jgi:hypothetical protein
MMKCQNDLQFETCEVLVVGNIYWDKVWTTRDVRIELHAPTSSTQKFKLIGKGGQFTYTPTVRKHVWQSPSHAILSPYFPFMELITIVRRTVGFSYGLATMLSARFLSMMHMLKQRERESTRKPPV